MPDPKPPESDNVPAPGVPNVPPPSPPSDPPAAPAAPAKPPEPAKPSFRSLDDDLADFAKGDPPAAPAKPKPPKPPEEPKPPEDPKPPEPPEKPSEGEDDDYLLGPQAKPKEPPKPPEEPAGAPLKAPELRAAYAKVKQRLPETEKELQTLKSGGKPVEEEEKKTYLSEIEGLKKKLEDADSTIKAVAYERSQEYQDKYEKPFADAWNKGVTQIQRFNVQDQDGNTRKGTSEDFATIMRIPDDEQAAVMAQEMFGTNAFYVLSRREDIIKLHGKRVQALEEFQTNLGERQKAEMDKLKAHNQEQEERRIKAQTLFKKFNTEAAEKYPEFFAPVDGDEEGNKLLAKGYQDADLAFSAAQDMPFEKRVRLHAAIRNRAAAFSRLVHQLKGKDSEIEALKAELEDIKGSTPGPGQEGRERHEQKQLSADEEIEAAAMRNVR
jgi:hypothetical protein